jgi:hypothetical protein
MINRMQVCLDSSSCRVLYYSGNTSIEPLYDDGHIVLNNSYPCQTIESCTPFYYESANEPYFGTDYIFISNATTCANKHIPVVRCRLLTCDLNFTLNTFLTNITYLNITKDQNGSYHAKAY